MCDSDAPFDWIRRQRDQLLTTVKPEAFHGPNSQFIRATEELVNDRSARSRLGQGDIMTVDQFCALPADRRIEQLARLRLADQFDATALKELMSHEADADIPPDELTPRKDERGWFAKTLKWTETNGLQPGKLWSIGEWRTLGFVNDALNQSDQPLQGMATERIPLFLAGEKSGRVIWLVVDRMPGPPIITPHWWRLGLAPLGNQEQLLHAIHRGIHVVLESISARFQVRWWLEEYTGGSGWHDKIDEAESVQAAAACVTIALAEPGSHHPLLDPKAGVSAMLPDQIDHLLLSLPLEDVTRLKMKVQYGQRAEMLCMLFAPKSATEAAKSVTRSGDSPAMSVLPAPTLGEAYEMLCLTSSERQKAKLKLVDEWKQTHDDVDTDEVFVRLSQSGGNKNE